MASDKPLIKYVMKNDKKEDFFHSSGYAVARSGAGMGAASVESFSTRREMDENRKLVKSYRNARIMQGVTGVERAKTYTPRTEGGAGALNGPVVSNRGGTEGAVVSNRGGTAGAVVSNRGSTAGAVVSNRGRGTIGTPNSWGAGNGTPGRRTTQQTGRQGAPLAQANGPKPMRQAPPTRRGV